MEDFSQLTFNVMDCPPPKLVVDNFVKLSKYECFTKNEFSKALNDKIIRYIILFYDKNTPLKDIIDDITQRKTEAAKLAGFKLVNNHFEDVVHEIMKCDNPSVNKMIFTYSKIFNSRAWTTFITMQDIYYKELQKTLDWTGLLSATEVKKIDDLGKMVDRAQNEVLNEDKNIKLQQELLSFIEETDFAEMPTPENIAAKRRDGKEGVTLEEIS